MVTKLQSLFAVFSLAAALWNSANGHAQTTPVLSVNAAANQHAINPNIYGIASYGLDASFAQEIQVPNVRWGGDGASRYNWEVDSSNSGFDWYFMGGSGVSNPVPSASADLMINTYKSANAGALITIPIIPYVNNSSAWSCSFPTSIYGAQQSTNPYVHPNGEDCGNSISSTGAQLTDIDIVANNLPNSTALQQGWLRHLVSTFGAAAQGGVPFYQLDNEPSGWGNTHRDIEPNGANYKTIISLGQQYAAAIKQVDPTATVLGPSDFTLGGWVGTPSLQNNLYAGQYYLQKMATYNRANGKRILDYFDEHYYPQFTDATSQLASTRTFWDPTYNGGTWVEQYDFDGPMQLIPRFQQWIAQYYPGTGLSFSEYSIDSGNKLITDGLAEADVLGIFGWQQVDLANMWSPPAPTDPIAYAFRLYRNYDGLGSQFGATSISAGSSDPAALPIYGAFRSSDGSLTLVVLNKTTAATPTTLSLGNFSAAGSAAIYSYSNADLTQITSQGNVSLVANSLTYTYPAYSATMIVVAPPLGEAVGASSRALQFGTAPFGTSTSLSLNLTNHSSAGAVTATASINGPSYLLSANGCKAGIKPGNSCALQVAFSPVKIGPHNDILTITPSAGPAISVELSGIASAAAVSILPASGLAFGTIAFGTTATLPLTIKNVASAGAVTATETINGPSYKVLANNCLTGVTEGQTCTMQVEFDPRSAAPHNDVMTITTNSGDVYRVNLTGVASQP
ncbi:cellulase, putative [Acidisarcina polymorpha]|uniref:Cellulase, putative n=1 Tax=Acidisarcina polymorpha TaxID=2211140 RepID=A0A2Z5FWY4_9BACT|nr:glycoside hydrolase family 44 protein [Acidisarcina polymorpha]AXC11409.1 cellulase, putative [Acidisarcina polymorpha]